MKKATFIFLYSLHLISWSQTNDEHLLLNELRTIFVLASYDKTLLPKVDQALLNYNWDTPTKKAYYGAKIALTARSYWNPIEQISTLKTGLTIINEAVAEDPNNIEIRFIRFATLHHVPTFLGLSDPLESDKAFVLNHIQNMKDLNITLDFAASVYKFIIESKRFSEEEIINFHNEMVKLYAQD